MLPLTNKMVEVPLVLVISISILVLYYFRLLQTGQVRHVVVGIVAFILLLMQWIKKWYATHEGATLEPWLVGSAGR